MLFAIHEGSTSGQRNKWIALAPRQTGIEQTLHRGYRFVELERCPPNENARRARAGHPVRATPSTELGSALLQQRADTLVQRNESFVRQRQRTDKRRMYALAKHAVPCRSQ